MTEPSLTPVEDQEPEAEKQRERSTIGFPYNDLNDGIKVAIAVHGLGDRCSHEQLITPLGYSGVDNGSYKMILSAARHFGLISQSKEGVTLTSLGHKIVDPTQEARARADAFLAVPLYKKLYEEYKGHSLPPTNIGLEAVLVGYGVAAKQKDKARQVLQRSAEQAGYFFQGRERLVLPAVANRPQEKPPMPPGNRGGGSVGDGGSSSTRTLALRSGGQVTLTLSVDLFDLSETDRTFVLDLVDKMKKYVEDNKPRALPAPRSESTDADNGSSGSHTGYNEPVRA